MAHRAGRDLVREREVRHVPENTILDATAGVFGRGGFQFKELADALMAPLNIFNSLSGKVGWLLEKIGVIKK